MNGKNEERKDHDSHGSRDSHPILPPRGDYQTLLSFQKAQVVYDITFRFAHKFLSRGDRTIDQMIQSARSGKKNTLEGSKAALTSKETEIKLTNVARASLEELLDDYLDYLRVRELPLWAKDSKEALFVRKLGRKMPPSYEDYREFVETRPPDEGMKEKGERMKSGIRLDPLSFILYPSYSGLRERMTRVRLQYREGRNRTNARLGS
jgi:hypothetical protein